MVKSTLVRLHVNFLMLILLFILSLVCAESVSVDLIDQIQFYKWSKSNPLAKAILEHDTRLVQKYMKYDYLNQKDQQNRTVLQLAIAVAPDRITSLLIDSGIDLNAKDTYGMTALMYAVTCRNIKITKLLIEKRVDLDSTNNYDRNALMMALYQDEYDIFSFLVDSGANLNTKSDSNTVLMMAAFTGQHRFVELLLNSDLNARNENGMTALMMASANNHTLIVDTLIKNGAAFNMTATSNFYRQSKNVPSSRICEIKYGFGETLLLNLLGSGQFGRVYLTNDCPPTVVKIASQSGEALMVSRAAFNINYSSMEKLVLKKLNLLVQSDYSLVNGEMVQVLKIKYLPGFNLLTNASLFNESIKEMVYKQVDQLHSMGIFHGDLHRGNLLLDTEQNKINIVDFGFAQLLDCSFSNCTEAKQRDLSQLDAIFNPPVPKSATFFNNLIGFLPSSWLRIS